MLSSVSDDDDEGEFFSSFCCLFHTLKCVNDIVWEQSFISEIVKFDTFSLELWNHGATLIEDQFIDVIQFFWSSLLDIFLCKCPETHVRDSFAETEPDSWFDSIGSFGMSEHFYETLFLGPSTVSVHDKCEMHGREG